MIPRTQIIGVTSHGLSDEGSYWTLANPTPGTGLATIAALTTEVDTSPFVQINAGAKPVSIDYIAITCTAPGTGGTSLRYSVRTDSAKAVPTGGTTLAAVNCNGGISGAVADFAAYAGPLVAAAGIAAVRPTSRLLRPVIPVIGDTYVIKFGGADQGINSLTPGGGAIAAVYIGAPPVTIGAGKTGQLHLWLPGQSVAAAFEFEIGLWARS